MYYRILIICLFPFVNIVYAQQTCAPVTVNKEIEKVVATANPFYNSINAKGSLSFESQRLLSMAQGMQQTPPTPDAKCSAPCMQTKDSIMLFTTIPNKLLEDYSEKASCLEMQNKTKLSPFIFTPEPFDNTAAFSAWFSDFSRGNGKDGKKLYKLCPGACSPQYTVTITQQDNKLKANANIICGEARDKSDNQYQLGVTLQWACLPSQ